MIFGTLLHLFAQADSGSGGVSQLGDAPWIQTLLLFAISGFFGGILAAIQYTDVDKLLKAGGILGTSSDTNEDTKDTKNTKDTKDTKDTKAEEKGLWKSTVLGLLISGLGGVGGAAAALFLMLADDKIKPGTLDDRARLVFVTTGVIAGFIGIRLLKYVALQFDKQLKEHVEATAAKKAEEISTTAAVKAEQIATTATVKAEEKAKEIATTVAVKAEQVATTAEEAKTIASDTREVVGLEKKITAQIQRQAALAVGRLVQFDLFAINADSAVTQLEPLFAANPTDREIALTLGWIYANRYQDNKLEDAIRVLSGPIDHLRQNQMTNTPTDQSNLSDLLYNRACYYARLAKKEGYPSKDTELGRNDLKLAAADLDESCSLNRENWEYAWKEDKKREFDHLKTTDVFSTLWQKYGPVKDNQDTSE